MERILEKISATLEAVGGRSAFTVEERTSAGDLDVRVRGVGRVRFPVTEGTAEKLIATARPAPFGVRDETRYDEQVRSTWEIAADQIMVGERFERALAEKLDTVRRRLGLPRGGALRPVLDKLLVYGPGQFFAPHQDSERADGMLATLVAVLPSRHTGGAIVVTHNGKRHALAGGGADDDIRLVAFYADCRHEVERVKTGHRVALTYHLVHDGPDRAQESVDAGSPSASIRLTESVRAYFATPRRLAYGQREADAPDRLVYLLDHEYTRRGLGFGRLKGKDRPRVSAFLGAAERLDCEAYLALAEVHEVWSCDEDDWGGGYGRYGGRRFEPRERSADEYELLDLCDSEVTLGHWVGRDGAADPGVPAYASDEEICTTRRSVEMAPFRSEHEGYMGNYGNTIDRWYHRAALVLWPKSRAFVVRAKGSPVWAANEILRLLAADKKAEAEENARTLLPFWRHGAAAVKAPTFAPKVFRLAATLGDPDLAKALLAPLGADSLTTTSVPLLLTAAQRFGLAWSRDLFAGWVDDRGEPSTWIGALPLLCRALASTSWPDARPLGSSLLEAETTAYRDRVVKDRGRLAAQFGTEVRAALVRDAAALIVAAGALENRESRERMLGILSGPDTAPPAAVLVDILDRCRQDCPPRELRRLGLGPLHDRATHSLRDALAQPPRASDDWSLASPLDCDCPLCKRFAAFLRDRTTRELPWPLAKDGRRHVHGMIERFDLPVAHDTIRKGSPHTLMLEKQAVLFSREGAARKREASLLAALERTRPAYVDTRGSSPRRSAKARPTRVPRASSDRARLSRP